MAKKALLVGCNYPGTDAELKGCVNDVRRMQRTLIDRFGFAEKDIRVLIDTDQKSVQPTGSNIRKLLSQMVTQAKAGDTLFFHYSGHGVRVPAESDDLDDTGYDECILPTDMNLITDDDFREIADKVPEGCSFTIVSDSCHSGGLIEQLKQQIEDRGRGVSADSHFLDSNTRKSADGKMKPKCLSIYHFIKILNEKTGRKDLTVGNIRAALFDIFREEASPKVKKFMAYVVKKLENKATSMAIEFLQSKLDECINGTEYVNPALQTQDAITSPKSAYAGIQIKQKNEAGILLSGCKSSETSADANPTGDPKDAYGALSNAIQIMLNNSGNKITNSELVVGVRKLLMRQGFKQRPCLFCSDNNTSAPFICPQTIKPKEVNLASKS